MIYIQSGWNSSSLSENSRLLILRLNEIILCIWYPEFKKLCLHGRINYNIVWYTEDAETAAYALTIAGLDSGDSHGI